MTEIPQDKRNKFLLYLNDYVHENTEWIPMFEGKTPQLVLLEWVNTGREIDRDYTIIRFTDESWMIIPDVYSEFIDACELTNSTA